VKILFLTPTPPDTLHRIRALHLLKCLAHSHEVHLLSFVRHARDQEQLATLQPYCARIYSVPFSLPRALMGCLLALPSRLPLRVAYYRQAAMYRQVQYLLRHEHFDVVYVKRKRMAQFVQQQSSLPRILDLTDAVSLYYQRSLQTIDWLRWPLHVEEFVKIRHYEVDILRYFERGVVCSSVDHHYLTSQASRPIENLRVIPNVVDVHHYAALSPVAIPEQPILLFSGLMDKHVNIDAATYLVHDIFPRIRHALPHARLQIVGPRPASQVQKLGQMPGVHVTGHVADIRTAIAQASVVLCPMRVGAGTRNKILQGMAMARPIVSTPLGAEGIEYTDGVNVLIASDAEAFARQSVRVLQDKTLQESLAVNGRRLVATRYSLEQMAVLLHALLQEVVCGR
jgi:sugar transferase (PEP-CTERM/EpsH1 system associated)